MSDATALINIKFIIGSVGADILRAIHQGARSVEMIRIVASCPEVCVRGRIPVLLDLGLIEMESETDYLITDRGARFQQVASA